jgi:hypothetical protein
MKGLTPFQTKALRKWFKETRAEGRSPTTEEAVRFLETLPAGLIEQHRTRFGVTTGLYYAEGQGIIETDEHGRTYKYLVICEDHGTNVSVSSLAMGRHTAAHPDLFCDDCREKSCPT